MAGGDGHDTGDAVPWDVACAIDAACDRFEAEWRAGHAPAVEEFLDAQPEPVRAPLRRELTLLLRSLTAGDGPAAPAAVLGPGTELGGYVVLGPIGKGGMGVVYKALHRRLRRPVALKTLSPALRASDDAVSRFDREVRLVARLSHPNIVAAHDALEYEGTPFLVMEFVEGTDLAQLVREQGPLDIGLATDVARQAARGLDYAHRAGIIHRDIKPSNLLLDTSGTVKILDLGLARFLGAAAGADGGDETTLTILTRPGAWLGTVDFMAPEQAADTRRADARSDLYSLGCTLYFLLTGRPPYARPGASLMERALAHRDAPIPSVRAARPELPEGLDAVIRKLLARDPRERYATAGELLLALDRGSASPGRAGSRRRLLIGTAGALAVAGVGLGARAWWPPARRRGVEAGPPVEPAVPPKARPGDPARRVAEAVFRLGGRVQVVGRPDTFETPEALPEGPFRLLWADLERFQNGTPRQRWPVVDADLALFEGLAQLENLHLGSTGVTDAGLDHLATVVSLKGIYLPFTRVTRAAIPKLARFPLLVQVVLLGTDLGDDSLPPLLALKSLLFLNLTRTRVTDRGLEVLAGLPTLESLDVAQDAITDGGLAHVGRMSRLVRLNLEETAVTDAGLAHLRGLTGLKEIRLRGSRVSEPGVRCFQDEHPGCQAP